MLLDLVRDETPAGTRTAELLPHQQGTLVAPGSESAVRAEAPAKPEGANFYPEGASKAEIERWMQSLPASERARATGFFTVVRRGPTGAFTLVTYSLEHQNELLRIAGCCSGAAQATEPTLKTFLTKRADAFLSNDYYDSDVAWMELARRRSSRPSVRTRCTRTSSSTTRPPSSRSSRSATKPRARSSRSSAASCRTSRTTCRSIRAVATRSSARLAPIAVVNEVFAAGDAQPRRPDRGLQPAQRRARDTRKGRQARDAEERPGREVREDADADFEGRARAGRSDATSRSRRSSHTS